MIYYKLNIRRRQTDYFNSTFKFLQQASQKEVAGLRDNEAILMTDLLSARREINRLKVMLLDEEMV